MVDFGIHLTAEARARLEAKHDELDRLFGLPDRWLAEELLRLARTTRQAFPEKLKDPWGIIYDANFVWHVVPEVAKRLGATNFQPNEAADTRVVGLDNAALREVVGSYVKNISFGRWAIEREDNLPLAPEILANEPCNGNPVAFAMDRLAPAPEAGCDRDDYVARSVREVSRARRLEETPYWSPAMQHWRRNEPKDADDPDHTPTGFAP